VRCLVRHDCISPEAKAAQQRHHAELMAVRDELASTRNALEAQLRSKDAEIEAASLKIVVRRRGAASGGAGCRH